jgi:hypothetical protein
MENIVQSFDSSTNAILEDLVRKPTIIRGLVHLLLMLYVVRLAPQPPKAVLNLFENIYFKLFIFSLVLWTAQFSPSTSLLIALAFLVTMNYVNTGKVWEYLENVKGDEAVAEQLPVVSADDQANQAIQAINVLAEAATTPTAVSPEVVGQVVQLAMDAVKTQEGADAIKALANQAVEPEAGDPSKVLEAAQAAVDSIVQQAPVVPVVDAQQAVSAVQALAEAAASPEAYAAKDVIPIANIAAQAAAAAGDANGVAAVKALAEQAMKDEAGKPEQVGAAAQAALAAVVPAPVVPVVDAQQAVSAVQALAEAAASPDAYAAKDVIPVANIAAQAAAAAGDANGVAAVKALAEQAMKDEAGKPEQVGAATQAALAAFVPTPAAEQPTGAPTPAAQAAQASGCYPMRNYDMSLVKPQTDGRFGYENYQPFTSSVQ